MYVHIHAADPITRSGKRLQMIRMVGLTLIPILLLLGLTDTYSESGWLLRINQKRYGFEGHKAFRSGSVKSGICMY